MIRIGIDVGGTFTDFAMFNDASGGVYYFKHPSTPHDPSEAIQAGLKAAMEKFGVPASDICFIGHGTTVGTNMVIERRGAKTAVITTKGFRDVLEIGRQVRPSVYDYSVVKPVPLAARQHRIEVSERVDVHGKKLVTLNEDELREKLWQQEGEDIEAVAICFLHSYLFPEHEKRTEAIVAEVFPDLFISRSSDVLPEFREFERFSTTLVNATLGPKMQDYLDQLIHRLEALGIGPSPYTIHSNGGLMSIPTVRRYPVRTCLSGPAAGVIGAARIARDCGMTDVITFDVGGTSTDVSLIIDGEPKFTTKREVAEYPVKTPMVDIKVIGAGGGSIARVDEAGALKVGPESAGAVPGPVAYMRGGTKPTLTDANVVLGRLNPVALLDGTMPVDREAAHAVIEKDIAEPLGLTVEQAAFGVLRIAVSNMARAIRTISTERGFDLSDFALLAYGGAGPLHAVETAVECGMTSILVPREPGTLCARGILMSEISLDFVQSRILPLRDTPWSTVTDGLAELRVKAYEWLISENIPQQDHEFRYTLEARYEGQNHEIQVELEDSSLAQEVFLSAFEDAHFAEYGYKLTDRAIEVVNFRVRGMAHVPKAVEKLAQTAASVEDAVAGQRQFFVCPDTGWVDAKIYARGLMPVEGQINGPAIVEDMSSTSIILPGQTAHVDSVGNLIISLTKRLQ